MKTIITPFLIGLALLASLLPVASTAAEASRKLLVVTTTAGFRHSSIPTAEKVLSQLAAQSGAFTLEFVRQPPNQPTAPKAPAALKADASAVEQTAFKAAEEEFQAAQAAFTTAKAQWDQKMKEALSRLSPESLKGFDGVIFANTTGDLPIPDREGFLRWLRSGKAFIGIHAASDTFHGWPAYIEMLGGEFKTHGPQVSVDCLNEAQEHPADQQLGKVWTLTQEEIYQFKNYDPAKVSELLVLDKHPNDKTPGHFPVSWCRQYGQGKVFYTSLGHREDIWDADPNIPDRKNSVEISKAYQAHILGGIKWALGIAPAGQAGSPTKP
jgi:type 1 glutamine amidotransferase